MRKASALPLRPAPWLLSRLPLQQGRWAAAGAGGVLDGGSESTGRGTERPEQGALATMACFRGICCKVDGCGQEQRGKGDNILVGRGQSCGMAPGRAVPRLHRREGAQTRCGSWHFRRARARLDITRASGFREGGAGELAGTDVCGAAVRAEVLGGGRAVHGLLNITCHSLQ